MFKNQAATDLVAAMSPTSRRLLCNLAGTDRGHCCDLCDWWAIDGNNQSRRGRKAVSTYVWPGLNQPEQDSRTLPSSFDITSTYTEQQKKLPNNIVRYYLKLKYQNHMLWLDINISIYRCCFSCCYLRFCHSACPKDYVKNWYPPNLKVTIFVRNFANE